MKIKSLFEHYKKHYKDSGDPIQDMINFRDISSDPIFGVDEKLLKLTDEIIEALKELKK